METDNYDDYAKNSFLKRYVPQFKEGMQWINENPFETVIIKSIDGLSLTGYLLACENAKRTVICVHGYRGSGKKDFSFVSKFYHENNCNLLLIDQRAHGKSEGKYICYGYMERHDCVLWADFIVSRFGKKLPIYFDGVSMGCSSVILTLGLKLPDNLKGIIADCGYSSAWEQFRHVLKSRVKLPAFPVLYIADFMCRRRAGWSFGDVSTLEVLRCNKKIPILFIHGESDKFVPTKMSLQNYEACSSPKQLEIVKGAVHAVSYLTDIPYCQAALINFFNLYDCNNSSLQ